MGDLITVTLSIDEMQLAAVHGVMRTINVAREGRGSKNCNGVHSWNSDVEACCAELAWCKYRGIFWTGLEKYRAKDGGDVEVRWTKHQGTGGLIAYPRDEDNCRIVLIDGLAPTMNIIGYLLGSEAKTKETWIAQGKGYFLNPRSTLHPIQNGAK